MSMNPIQFLSGLSVPKFSQPFGIKALCKAILEKALYCSVQLDDACFNGELSSDSVDRGPENKMCFVTAVSVNDEGHPLHVKLTSIPFTADGAKYNLSSGCLMLSDGLTRFDAVADADCQHQAIRIDRVKLEYFLHFVPINKLRVRLKPVLTEFIMPLPSINTLFDASIPRHFANALFSERQLLAPPPRANARLRSTLASY